MLRVYIGKRLNYSLIPLLFPNFGQQKKDTILFVTDGTRYITKQMVEIVDDAREAEFLLIPHNFFQIQKENAYLAEYEALAEKLGKKIIVFAYGDSDKDIPVKHSIIFRTSRYRWQKVANEIMMPAYAEDMSSYVPVQPRKKSALPTVGFCGWAAYGSLYERLRFYRKIFKIFLSSSPKSLYPGLYFRQRALSLLSLSKKVATNFIIRKSYSGHVETISLDPHKARREYVANLADCDFALAVKGGGNFSYRFYEALSLGRIPLLIDTDCILPLASTIDYSKAIFHIDHKVLDSIDTLTSAFYKNLSPEAFVEYQKQARLIFEKYLRIDAFLEHYFMHPERIHACSD